MIDFSRAAEIVHAIGEDFHEKMELRERDKRALWSKKLIFANYDNKNFERLVWTITKFFRLLL